MKTSLILAVIGASLMVFLKAPQIFLAITELISRVLGKNRIQPRLKLVAVFIAILPIFPCIAAIVLASISSYAAWQLHQITLAFSALIDLVSHALVLAESILIFT